jgi:hypothetical protein
MRQSIPDPNVRSQLAQMGDAERHGLVSRCAPARTVVVKPCHGLCPIDHAHPAIGDPEVRLDGGLRQAELVSGQLPPVN